MKSMSLVFVLLLFAACDSPKVATKDSVNSEAQPTKREMKTSFGKAVRSAKDLGNKSEARNSEMEKELGEELE